MDISTLLGIILGVASVILAMIFKEVNFDVLLNEAAFTVIVAGTIATVVIAFPMNDLKYVGKLFGILFLNKKRTSDREVIDILCRYAEEARSSGILVLENKIPEISDPFLKRGVLLLTDNNSSDAIRDQLSEEIAAMEERHAMGAGMFTQAGTYAPTLGVLGAVLGLIAALGNMDDTDALGHAISAAFVATMLGIFTGYVLWHPFANKLKRKSKQEVATKHIIVEGLCSIADGHNPNNIRESLLAYLRPSERNKPGKEK